MQPNCNAHQRPAKMNVSTRKHVRNDSPGSPHDAGWIHAAEETNEVSRGQAKYGVWCAANGVNLEDNGGDQQLRSCMQKDFDTWQIDPPRYPGLNFASAYFMGHDLEYYHHYEALSRMGTPDIDLAILARLPKLWLGHMEYSKDFRNLIVACLKEKPEERSSTRNLAKSLHRKCANLLANGLLSKVPFEFCY
jgi:hypothetical protein